MAVTRPWRKFKGMPSERTLRSWRVKADRAARDVDCPGACHICFRPVDGRRGQLRLMAPGTWRQKAYDLPICTACWSLVKTYIMIQQAELHRDYLAPEVTGDNDEKLESD